MQKGVHKGRLSVIFGPMFSGKTRRLIEIYGDGQNAVVFKPSIDVRYSRGPVVISKDKSEIPCVMVNSQNPDELLMLVDGCRRILIDEGNLFDPKLVGTIESLLDQGLDVVVSGLMHDSERQGWEPMRTIVAMADESTQLSARCDGEGGKCVDPAIWSYRKSPKEARVKVAGADEYGAACGRHYTELHHKPRRKAKRGSTSV